MDHKFIIISNKMIGNKNDDHFRRRLYIQIAIDRVERKYLNNSK
jgi:hypothetical protein